MKNAMYIVKSINHSQNQDSSKQKQWHNQKMFSVVTELCLAKLCVCVTLYELDPQTPPRVVDSCPGWEYTLTMVTMIKHWSQCGHCLKMTVTCHSVTVTCAHWSHVCISSDEFQTCPYMTEVELRMIYTVCWLVMIIIGNLSMRDKITDQTHLTHGKVGQIKREIPQ